MRNKGQGIRCLLCERIVHVKCAQLGSRTLEERMRERYKCKWCVEAIKASMRRGNGDNADGGVSGGGQYESGNDKLVLMQWNCDHLMAKCGELEAFLEKEGIDVALIQETKLREEDVLVKVKGYEVVRKDRKREGMSRYVRGGGLAVLVRKGLWYRVIEVDSEIEKGGVEIQAIEGH